MVNEEDDKFTNNNHKTTTYNAVAVNIETLKPTGGPLLTPMKIFDCLFKVDKKYLKWGIYNISQKVNVYMDKMVFAICCCYHALMVVELKSLEPICKHLDRGTTAVYNLVADTLLVEVDVVVVVVVWGLNLLEGVIEMQ